MIRNIVTAAAFGLCLMGSAMAGEAQNGTQPAATQEKGPSAAQLKAAKALMDTGIADQFLDSQKIVDAVLTRVRMHEPDVDPDTLQTIRKILIEEFDANKDKMLHEFTVLYAVNFSVTDLHALAKFYRSPTGQHMIAKSPEIGAESSQLVMPFMFHAMKRMREELMAQMAAKEKATENAAKAAEKKAGEDKIKKAEDAKAKSGKTTGDDEK